MQRQHTGGSLHAGRAGHSPPSPPGRSAHAASQGFSSLPRRSGSCPRRSLQVRAPGCAVSLVLTGGHWLCVLLSVWGEVRGCVDWQPYLGPESLSLAQECLPGVPTAGSDCVRSQASREKSTWRPCRHLAPCSVHTPVPRAPWCFWLSALGLVVVAWRVFIRFGVSHKLWQTKHC